MNQEQSEGIEVKKEEFNQLFKELAGISASQARHGEDGWLFIPKEANLGAKDSAQRRRLAELAGPGGWRNNLTNDDYDGWWVRPIE